MALTKLVHMGDTAETLATAYANELNNGYMSFWASASGNVLTITARMLGIGGEREYAGGGVVGYERVDGDGKRLGAGGRGGWDVADGSDGVAAVESGGERLDHELLHGAARIWDRHDGIVEHGVGERGSVGGGGDRAEGAESWRRRAGSPIVLPTPSLQTNFSPTSLAFWQEAYAEIAAIQASVGLTPFLQFGEVQWWYFPTNGLPCRRGAGGLWRDAVLRRVDAEPISGGVRDGDGDDHDEYGKSGELSE